MTHAPLGCLLLVFVSLAWAECMGQPARPSAKGMKKLTRAGSGLRMSRDFGLVDRGAEVQETFEVQNKSREPLRLGDPQVSCGCISIVDQPKSVDAGESVSIAVRLDTSRMRGAVKHSVTFKVDHPKQRYVRLVVEGTVRGVWTEPETLDLGSITSQKRARQRFFIFAAGMPDLDILSVRASDAFLEVNDGPANADDATRRKGIRGVRSVFVGWGDVMAPPGVYSGEVAIDTNDQRWPTVTVSVTAHVTGAVDVKPPLLLFGTVVHGKSVERSCRIRLGDDDAAHQLDGLIFETDHEQVVCRLASGDSDDGAAGTLRVVLTAAGGESGELIKGAARGKRDGKVVVSVPYVAYLARD